MKSALAHFKQRDPVMYAAAQLQLAHLEILEPEVSDRYFWRLCRTVIGQQLSGKAADAMVQKYVQLFPTEPTPEQVLALSHEQLRAVGLSHAKAQYLQNLAQSVVSGQVVLSQLPQLSDAEVIAQLTQVKGIGPWSAEMFLIFVLCRPDVFSYGDLGLKKGLMLVYGLKREPTREKMARIVKPWSPYKSLASRVLWASLDNR